jgi:hypothetical protein
MPSRLIQYFVSVHRYALAGRFFRLGSAKTNKAEAPKLRSNGDMEENAALAVAYTCGNTSAKHIHGYNRLKTDMPASPSSTGTPPAHGFASDKSQRLIAAVVPVPQGAFIKILKIGGFGGMTKYLEGKSDGYFDTRNRAQLERSDIPLAKRGHPASIAATDEVKPELVSYKSLFRFCF